MLPGLIGALVLTLPGLIFASKLNQGASFETVVEASKIQVFERLPHHLFPLAFEVGYIPRHLILWALFIVLCLAVPPTQRQQRLQRFIFTAMCLAVIGFILAWIASIGPTTADSKSQPTIFAAFLLRFYWSRLSDILVPLGVSLLGLQFLTTLFVTQRTFAKRICIALSLLILYDGWQQIEHFPFYREDTQTTRADRDDFLLDADGNNSLVKDWRDTCHWAADNTPPGTVFITPMNCSTFKWYSDRDEVANWKDMPQDAPSVVAWWQRLNELYATGSKNPDNRWRSSLFELDFQQVQNLATRFGAQYVIVKNEIVKQPSGTTWPNNDLVYSNPSFAIYRISTVTDNFPSSSAPDK
jgi:hypothetical protein